MARLRPTCKEATQLLAQQEHVGISLINSVRLRWHLSGCQPCKHYVVQIQIISQAAAQSTPPECDLSTETLQRLRASLDREIRS